MKYITFTNKLALLPALVATLALASTTTYAQMGHSPSKSMNMAMMKLFGDNNNFTSKAEISISKAGKTSTTMPINFALAGDKMRTDIDMTQIKSTDMPANAMAMMKQMGMDQMSTIMLPEKKMTYIIYPSLKAYAEQPMDKDDVIDATKNYKIEKTALGKETIDGHPTQKNKVVMTDDKGQKQEATVWNATDLKDFPVQMQMNEDSNVVLMHYKDIKLGKPDANKFEVPTGMTKYSSAQQLMQAEMTKRMGNGGGFGAPPAQK
ncbi:DUF4412 domain-containing protein [Pedosphaera parvula]|uniref:DUF4412 domain-containing protein n=1 Tax=Pedosphaera parvula (strain Ellin514) TaxID=320771 RepID=B9XFA4_PEDPL|nr:DUF4412 domain-containing protein [Pedosphaera parvula]EEF61602.1 hypothetical protein Cflav_PD4281 [Pedosphaera parvula Ellin514]